MTEYNYNFETAMNIAFFQSVFDDITIKRYDHSNRRITDTIKVNVVHGPKSRLLSDRNGQTDNIKLPSVAVTMSSQGKDMTRQKSKAPISYRNSVNEIVNLVGIPWNIVVKIDIIAKYREDVDQIVNNFATIFNPTAVFTWQEPKSGRAVESVVEWDGQMNYEYPTHGGKQTGDMPWQFEATTTFTIKTYLYRTSIENSKPICQINLDVIPVNTFYCDYGQMSAYYADKERDSFVIYGCPQLKWVSDYYFKTGDTPSITVQGDGLNGLYGMFLSGSNPDMYPLTKYYPVSGSSQYFEGYAIPEYTSTTPTEVTFVLPAPSAFGFCDIIAVNSCGWSKLTEDANRCSRVLNPYPVNTAEHYSWCVLQYPYLNGLIISNNLNDKLEISSDEDIIVVER